MSRSLFGRGLFGIWLRFGSVTGVFKPAPSPKPRRTPKSLAAPRYIFSVNALARRGGKLSPNSEAAVQCCLAAFSADDSAFVSTIILDRNSPFCSDNSMVTEELEKTVAHGQLLDIC